MSGELEHISKSDREQQPTFQPGPQPAEDEFTNTWTRTEQPDGTVHLTETETRRRLYK